MNTECLTQAVCRELFIRSRSSARMGFVGIGIMLFAHHKLSPLSAHLWWAIPFALAFAARIGLAGYALAKTPTPALRAILLHVETVLCALCGFGWGVSAYVFDNDAMDQAFFLRVTILAAVQALVVSSLSVFMRLFLAYSLALVLPLVIFIVSHEQIAAVNTLLACILAYMLLMISQSYLTHKRIRQSLLNHQCVLELSESLNLALSNEKVLREKFDALSKTDELTGVMNRRGVLSCLDLELLKSARYRWPLAILVIDIDHFKPINDMHGHAVGDAAIQLIAQTLAGGIRQTDVLGRIGGEEFLALLPMSGRDGALLLAERLRVAVEAVELTVAGQRIPMSISIGVALYREGDDGPRLISRADQALYAAKHNGRNRIEALD